MDVETRIEGAVAVITINRPDKRNAINGAVADGMEAALARLEEDDRLRVGVITGAGKDFCAGMDLKAYLNGEKVRSAHAGFAGITQNRCTKPLIAAVEGHALAGGLEVALACDFIIAAETARIGLPEVKRGLVAMAGGLLRLPRQLPARIAAEMALSGDIYPITDFAHYGLVNRIVAEGEALAAAIAFAGKFVMNAPLAIAASKQLLRDGRHWDEQDMFARQDSITRPIYLSEDAREGAAAYVEKRVPNWKGR